MTCPDCGYMMTAFDKECPRCEKLGGPEKSCLKCGTATGVRETSCRRCGHRFGDPVETPRPPAPATVREPSTPFASPGVPFAPAPDADTLPVASAPSPPEASPASGQSVLPADYLHCRVCGNAGVQKVSAVCQSGSWSGQSQGQTFGVAYSQNGPVPMSSAVTSSASGATALAQMLMPPPRPSFSEAGCALALGLVMAACGFASAAGCLVSSGDVGGVIGSLTVFGGGVAIYLSVKSGDWKRRRHVAEQTPRWKQMIVAWNRLFYCPRCAHVFDPAAGASVPAQRMRELL